MSNLLKSKFLLGVMVVAAFAVTVGVNAPVAAASSCSITTTLKLGSKGTQVACLQTSLGGLTADGNFGAKTKAAVVAWQSKSGLTADGVFGAKSNAKWMSNSGNSSNFPAGCASNVGFSPSTGQSCASGQVSTTTYPAGCSSASGYSPTTGASCATGAVNQQTGPVSVALSNDNPASGYIIANQATADLAHFTFNGTGTINTVVLQRTGISDQNTLTNVYLYQGATRLTDGFSFNNVGQLTMNGLAIAVNGSTTISVKADVANTSTASSLGITLIGFTAAGQTATTVNIAGNEMTYGVGNLASAYLGVNTVVSCAGSCPAVNAGTSAYTVWSSPVQVNTRAIWLKGANFRMVGSAPGDALQNIHLFVDGVQVGSAATLGTITGSNYAMFDFSAAPVTLSTGSHTVDVRADVAKGSGYSVTVSLQQASDLVLYDGQVGVNIAVLGAAGVAFTSNSGAQIYINAGSASVTVDPTFQAMTNITGGATNVAIAKFKVHGYGEDVKVSSLSVTPSFTIGGSAAVFANVTPSSAAVPLGALSVTSGGTGYVATPTISVATCSVQPTISATISGGVITAATVVTGGSGCTNSSEAVTVAAPVAAGLNNVTLYFNGSQVGSQQPWTSGALTFNLGSQMILPAGADSYIEVRADLQTTGSVNYTSGTVYAVLNNTPANNAQGQTSHNTLTFPASTTSFSSLTIQTGTLAVAQNGAYTAQVISPNTANAKIGSYILQNQSTSESVRVTSLTVSLWDSTGTPIAMTSSTTPALTNFSNLRTSETSGSGSQPIQPAGSNTFSVDFTIAPGDTKTIDVFADTSATTGTYFNTKLVVTSLGSSSNVSIAQNGTGAVVVGQVITLTAGTFGNAGVVISSSTAPQFVASGSTGATNATKATYNFKSVSGIATVTELKFKVTTSSGASVNTVTVNGVTAPVVNGVAYLTGLNIAVPNGGSGVNVDAFMSYGPVGTNGNTSGALSFVSIQYIKYQLGNTTSTLVGGDAIATGTTSATDTQLATLSTSTSAITGAGATETLTLSAAVNNVLQPGMKLVIPRDAGTPAIVEVQSLVSTNQFVAYNVQVGTGTEAASPVYFLSIPMTAAYSSSINNCLLGGIEDCMAIVGSKPTLGIVDASTQLINSSIKVASVTVTADAHGDIAINTLPLAFGSTGHVTSLLAANSVIVKNAADQSIINTTSTADAPLTVGNSDGRATVTFVGGYTVTAGSTVTLDIYATPANVTGGPSANTLATSLGAAGSFTWTDVAGNATGTSTGTLIYNYPTTSSIIND